MIVAIFFLSKKPPPCIRARSIFPTVYICLRLSLDMLEKMESLHDSRLNCCLFFGYLLYMWMEELFVNSHRSMITDGK